MGKLVKALIALLILGFVGVATNYTQFIALIDQVTQQMGVSQTEFINIATTILLFLGWTVIAPLTVGIIIGFLVGR